VSGGVRRLALAVAVGAAALTAARAPLPTPGTAAQIAKAVAASHLVKKVPTSMVPSLADEASDTPGTYFPITYDGCNDLNLSTDKCVFGDTSSSKTIVLFGDSHAQMWLPALDPIATKLGYRLVLWFELGCPAASVRIWDSQSKAYYTACTTFRSAALSAIASLRPSVVVLADRTSLAMSAPGVYFTDAQWKAGLEATIKAVDQHAKVVVIGDIPLLSDVPPQCLASNPTNVQHCAGKNPNTKSHAHLAAETQAAAATKAGYVNPIPWLCTATCSPIVGNLAVYSDSWHITDTYSEYLESVLDKALAHYLTG
jgi:hypothetical protein